MKKKMTITTKQNIKIAKILGFEIFDPGKESNSPIQWKYPNKYKKLIYGTPCCNVPDFVKMIDDYIDMIIKNPLVPKDYDTNMNLY